MASVLENLTVVLRGRADQLRDTFRIASQDATNFQSVMTGVQKQLNSLSGGQGLRFHAQGVKGALDLASAHQVGYQTLTDAASAAENYASTIRSLTNSQNNYAVAARSASSSNELVAQTSSRAVSNIVNASRGITSLQYSLQRLDLINYSLEHSSANWVQVLTRGPGKIIHGIEEIKKSLFGIIPAAHALEKIMKELFAPAAKTFATMLLEMRGVNEHAGQLAVNLAKLGGQLELLGSKGKTSFRLLVDEVARLAGRGLRGLDASMASTIERTQAMGRSLREAGAGTGGIKTAVVIQSLGQAAVQASQYIGDLAKHLFLASSAGVRFAAVMAGKAAWSLTKLAAAGIYAGTIAALSAAFDKVSASAMRMGQSIVGGPVRAMTSIPATAGRAAGSLTGLRKASTGAQFALMDLIGPVALLGAAGGAIYLAVKEFQHGMEWANATEQIKTSFETIIGSVERTKVLLHDIKGFASQTPFLLPDIQEAANTLLVFGVQAEQIVPTLKTLGDAAGGNAERFNDLVRVYGQLKSQGGSVQLDDLNQIARRGVPIFDELAKTMGKSQTELRAMITAGMVGLPDVQKAFVALTSEGGRMFQGLERQSKTMTGLMGRFKENVGLLFQSIAEEISKAFDFKGSLQRQIQFVQYIRANLVPAIVAPFKWAAQTIDAFTNFAVASWKRFGPDVMSVLSSVGDAAKQVWATMTDAAITALTWLNGALVQGGAIVRSWSETVRRAIWVVQFAFQEWRALLNYVFVGAEYQVIRFANIMEHIFTSVIPAHLKWFAQNFTSILSEGVNFALDLTAAAINKWSDVVIDNIVKSWKEAPRRLAELMQPVGVNAFNNLVKPLEKAQGPLEKFQGKLAGIFQGAPGAGGRVPGALENQLGQQLQKIGEGIKFDFKLFFDIKEAGLALRRIEEGPLGIFALKVADLLNPFRKAAAVVPPIPPLKPDDPNAAAAGKAMNNANRRSNEDNKAVERGTIEAYSAERKAAQEAGGQLKKVVNNGKVGNDKLDQLIRQGAQKDRFIFQVRIP